MKRILIAGLSLLVLISFARANETVPDNRYTLVETEEGTMRLDKKNGSISYCRKVSGGIACSMASDEREAWVTATEEMANRIDELEKRLSHLEALTDVPSDRSSITAKELNSSKQSSQIAPLEEQKPGRIDKALTASKGFLRSLITAVKGLDLSFGTE